VRWVAVPPDGHGPSGRDEDVVGVEEHEFKVGEEPAYLVDVPLDHLVSCDERWPAITEESVHLMLGPGAGV
jgi:hypothetical protein